MNRPLHPRGTFEMRTKAIVTFLDDRALETFESRAMNSGNRRASLALRSEVPGRLQGGGGRRLMQTCTDQKQLIKCKLCLGMESPFRTALSG